MQSEANESVVIENRGPVERLEIPLPEGGGVVVLEGACGAGKSTAIESLAGLGGAPIDANVRDGTIGGVIRGPGAVIELSRTTGKRPKLVGRLRWKMLDTAIDPSVLVHPGLVDKELADEARAKMLCALAGVRADRAPFERLHPLVAEVVSEGDAQAARSMPSFAGQIKRALHKRALEIEERAKALRAKAAGMAINAGSLDLDAPHDEATLAQASAAAERALAHAEGEASAATKRAAAWQATKNRLDEAVAKGGTSAIAAAEASIAEGEGAVERALAKENDAVRVLAEKDAALIGLERQLEELKLQIERARRDRVWTLGEVEAAQGARVEAERALRVRREDLARAKASDEALGELRLAVEAGAGDPGPSPERLAELRAARDAAARAIAEGARIRDAREKRAAAEEATRRAQAEEDAAEAIREAARATDDVVSELVARVAPSGLKMRGGRIFTTTDRGEELFDDLSEGERWTIAIDASIESVAPNGILALAQEAWQALDPERKRYTRERAKSRNVVVVTAEATNGGELRAEVLA